MCGEEQRWRQMRDVTGGPHLCLFRGNVCLRLVGHNVDMQAHLRILLSVLLHLHLMGEGKETSPTSGLDANSFPTLLEASLPLFELFELLF